MSLYLVYSRSYSRLQEASCRTKSVSPRLRSRASSRSLKIPAATPPSMAAPIADPVPSTTTASIPRTSATTERHTGLCAPPPTKTNSRKPPAIGPSATRACRRAKAVPSYTARAKWALPCSERTPQKLPVSAGSPEGGVLTHEVGMKNQSTGPGAIVPASASMRS
jgi:hypothetical protein